MSFEAAEAYREAGRLDEAIPLFESALEDTVQVLDGHHPSTLSSLTNLASAYQDAGESGPGDGGAGAPIIQ